MPNPSSATSTASSARPKTCSKNSCPRGHPTPTTSALVDPVVARFRVPVNPGAERFRGGAEGGGELDHRAEARFAAAALEQGDLGAVDLAHLGQRFLRDPRGFAGPAEVGGEAVPFVHPCTLFAAGGAGAAIAGSLARPRSSPAAAAAAAPRAPSAGACACRGRGSARGGRPCGRWPGRQRAAGPAATSARGGGRRGGGRARPRRSRRRR